MTFIKQYTAIILFLTLISAVEAQGLSFLKPTGKGSERARDIPTVITSDSMDIDVVKNTASFKGNVKVEDQELTITCHIMTIYFEEAGKKDGAVDADEGGNGDEPEAEGEGDVSAPDTASSRRITSIVCEGDVVITRKPPEGSKDKEDVQKALAGKANYNVLEGKITMTDDPMLVRNEEVLKATIIYYYTETGKASARGDVELKLRSELSTDDSVEGAE